MTTSTEDEIHMMVTALNDILVCLEQTSERVKQFSHASSHELRKSFSVILAKSQYALA